MALMLIVSCPVGVMRHSVWGMKLPNTANNREALAMMSPEDRQTLEEAQDADEFFILRRKRLRREDAEALASGKATPEELQWKNSIIPQDFWKHATIDWNSITNGTTYTLPGRLRRSSRKRPATSRRASR